MKIVTSARHCPACICSHTAPAVRTIRSVQFNTELARFINGLGLSGDGTVDWVLTELFDYRRGVLFGTDGTALAIESDLKLTDNLFGRDARRTINRYRERANRPFRYRLDRRLIWPVLAMHFAREIYLCRTAGNCSQR